MTAEERAMLGGKWGEPNAAAREALAVRQYALSFVVIGSFFAFGLTIDPADVGGVVWAVAAAVVASMVLNLAAGSSRHGCTASTEARPPTSASPSSGGASSR